MPLICSGKYKNGEACRYKAKKDGLCLLHIKKTEECSICLCDCDITNKKSICTLNCAHNFHKQCVETWFEKGNFTCPFCRATVDNTMLNKLNIKIDKTLFIVEKIEKLFEHNTVKINNLQDRYMRAINNIISGFSGESRLRYNVREYLTKKMNSVSEGNLIVLNDEIRNIAIWITELDKIIIITPNNTNLLSIMLTRLIRLYEWNSIE